MPPNETLAPFCIFLLTSITCCPSPLGNREVEKGNPLISPFTRICPRLRQSLAESKGRRMMVQFRDPPPRSRVARKDLALVVTGFNQNTEFTWSSVVR